MSTLTEIIAELRDGSRTKWLREEYSNGNNGCAGLVLEERLKLAEALDAALDAASKTDLAQKWLTQATEIEKEIERGYWDEWDKGKLHTLSTCAKELSEYYATPRGTRSRKLTDVEIEQRRSLDKRMAGRPFPPREAFEDCGVPMLNEDYAQAPSEPDVSAIEEAMCQPYCAKHSPRGITCACDLQPAEPQPDIKKCGAPAGSLIAGYSSFACVLQRGHKGEHQRGGNCFKHGEYVGSQCPKFPDCIPTSAERQPGDDKDVDVEKLATELWNGSETAFERSREIHPRVREGG